MSEFISSLLIEKQMLGIISSAFSKPAFDLDPEIVKTAEALSQAAPTDLHKLKTFAQSIVVALHRYATDHPETIDFLVQVYAKATISFPHTIGINGQHGSKAGNELLWIYLKHYEQRTYLGTGYNQDLVLNGKIDSSDRSNIVFTNEGVNDFRDHLDRAVQTVGNHHVERSKLLTAKAILGRAYALGLFDSGLHEKSMVDLYKGTKPHGQSKCEFIANCLCLRGCIRTLVSSVKSSGGLHGFLENVREGFTLPFVDLDCHMFEGFVNGRMDEGSAAARANDFLIQRHAALVIANIASGPHNETSQELFSLTKWVY